MGAWDTMSFCPRYSLTSKNQPMWNALTLQSTVYSTDAENETKGESVVFKLTQLKGTLLRQWIFLQQ